MEEYRNCGCETIEGGREDVLIHVKAGMNVT